MNRIRNIKILIISMTIKECSDIYVTIVELNQAANFNNKAICTVNSKSII